MFNKFSIVAALVAITVSVAGCGGGGSSSSGGTRADAVYTASQQHLDNSLLPVLAQFVSQLETLAQTADAFCAAPDATGLANLQQGWRDLLEQWFKLAAYNFGPMNADLLFPTISFIDSMRPNGTDYTATVRTAIDGQLAGTQTLDKAFFDALPFTNVGMLALEVLVFETADVGHSNQVADIVNEYLGAPRKCASLAGIIEQLDKHANTISDEWLVDFNNTGTPYRTSYVNRQLADGADPVATLMVAVQTYIDYLHKRNVAARGAQLSGHIWPALDAAIDEVETLLTGTSASTITFYSLMQSAGFGDDVDLVNNNIAAARAAIDAENDVTLEVTLKALDGNFKREILNGINIDPGINFEDGD